jgi:hypothetical protein
VDDFVLPFQTEFDPSEQSEGSLDPLGLYSIADALGVRLAPGVRERQSHPRYLTLALVGHLAVQGTEDTAAHIPPWLAYEWLVVRSLVHELRDMGGKIEAIPGSLKVSQALKAGLPICSETYLKTPTVFGFHGIYRVLGMKTGLFDGDGRTLTSGFEVLTAWERDQGMEGLTSNTGAGAELRRMLQRAVRHGLTNREIAEVPKELRQRIVKHLHPLQPGQAERASLWRALTESDPMRREYAGLLTSPEGHTAWLECDGSESKFHRWAHRMAGGELSRLLTAIRRFEQFARVLFDAFEEMRWRMSSEQSAVDKSWLASGSAVASAYKEAASRYDEALRGLAELDPALHRRAEAAFGWVAEAATPAEMAAGILAHHERTQKGTPPSGKRSWFDSFADGRLAIRPGYTFDHEFAAQPAEFVHAYRTRPICSFAKDLQAVPQTADA